MHAMALQSNTPVVVEIPVMIDRSSLQTDAVMVVVNDDFGDQTSRLFAVFRDEAVGHGIELSDASVAGAVSDVLRLYRLAHDEWARSPGNSVGFIYETTLPTTILRMGTKQVLYRARQARMHGVKDPGIALASHDGVRSFNAMLGLPEAESLQSQAPPARSRPVLVPDVNQQTSPKD